MKKTLGIIGGMGTFAGLRLAQHLAETARRQGALADYEFPSFLLFNLPVEGMDETGITDASAVRRQVCDSLDKMGAWGCDYALIACNTAHVYFQEFEKSFTGKLLNMVDIACCSLPRQVEGAVGVISSSTTRNKRLYADALAKRNFKTIFTSADEQQILDEAIKAVIEGSQDKTNFKEVHRVITDMTRRGASHIIVGCTELPIVISREHTDANLVDAGLVTIEAVFPLLR